MNFITQERAAEITRIAHGYWYDFVSYNDDGPGRRFNPDRIFNTAGVARINPCALAFFRYCAEITLGTGGATIVPVSSLRSSGSPSWLWHQGAGLVWILLDFGFVGDEIPPEEERKIVTRIVLHEVGHVVLHYRDIASIRRGRAPKANEIQEEEAWLFCGVLLGLALGLLAKSGRQRGITDEAWSKSC